MCTKHYQRLKKNGDPSISRQGQRPSKDPWDRFMEKVDVRSNGCWIWTGALFGGGYGAFRFGDKQVRAHIWAWERKNGPRPRVEHAGYPNGKPLPLDHFVCSTRSCVNPDHVRPVSDRENVLRSDSLQSKNAAKMECPQGHAYTKANTYVDKKGRRSCKACNRNRNRTK